MLAVIRAASPVPLMVSLEEVGAAGALSFTVFTPASPAVDGKKCENRKRM